MSFPSNSYNTRRFKRDPELIPAIGSGTGITRHPPNILPIRISRTARVVVPRVVSVEGILPRLRSRHVQSPYSRSSRDAERRRPERTLSPALLPCPICLDEMHPRKNTNISCLKCGHVFCTSCIIKWTSIKSVCPTCHKTVNGSINRLFLQ